MILSQQHQQHQLQQFTAVFDCQLKTDGYRLNGNLGGGSHLAKIATSLAEPTAE